MIDWSLGGPTVAQVASKRSRSRPARCTKQVEVQWTAGRRWALLRFFFVHVAQPARSIHGSSASEGTGKLIAALGQHADNRRARPVSD